MINTCVAGSNCSGDKDHRLLYTAKLKRDRQKTSPLDSLIRYIKYISMRRDINKPCHVVAVKQRYFCIYTVLIVIIIIIIINLAVLHILVLQLNKIEWYFHLQFNIRKLLLWRWHFVVRIGPRPCIRNHIRATGKPGSVSGSNSLISTVYICIMHVCILQCAVVSSAETELAVCVVMCGSDGGGVAYWCTLLNDAVVNNSWMNDSTQMLHKYRHITIL